MTNTTQLLMDAARADLKRIRNKVYCTTGYKIDNQVIAIILEEANRAAAQSQGEA